MDKLENQRIKVIKEQYRQGERVVLVRMEDSAAPQEGTLGTVMGVDDIGTVHIKWDTGETLGAIIGIDSIRKDGETEHKISINPFNT